MPVMASPPVEMLKHTKPDPADRTSNCFAVQPQVAQFQVVGAQQSGAVAGSSKLGASRAKLKQQPGPFRCSVTADGIAHFSSLHELVWHLALSAAPRPLDRSGDGVHEPWRRQEPVG